MKHQWNCSCVSGATLFLPNGFFSAGHPARSVESGSLSTPFGAAVLERDAGRAEAAVEQ